jgi:ubiquinone/menaquinone biosynthesis C-methylase UbiE
MNLIAASNALSEPDRVWAQHQAVLTLLGALLADPAVVTVTWLDLACGEGQILSGLEGRFQEEDRKKIAYTGIDRKDVYALKTQQIASSSGLQSADVKIGIISTVDQMLPGVAFDFITLINTIHEIAPSDLATVLTDAILRLSPNGNLYIYDMESIEPAELGAVAWSAAEFQSIVQRMLSALGVAGYIARVQHWQHKSRNGWSIVINRKHLGLPGDVSTMRQTAEAATKEKVIELLNVKLATCKSVLENLTTYGPETADEQSAEVALLYDLWAVSRALGDQ